MCGFRGLMILGLVLCGLTAAPALAREVQVNLGARSYLIDLPAHPSGAMIVGLHAAASSPVDFRDTTGMSARALPKGYAVVYPRGTGNEDHLSWNGLYCCGSAQANRVDDMRFLDLVIADAVARFGLDPGRVYLTGMSNGAVLAETYAVLRPGRVKAVGAVAGTMDVARTRVTPVPLLHIHGKVDTIVPYGDKGSQYGLKHIRTPFTPVSDEIAAFVAAFGPLTLTTRALNRVVDGTYVTEDDYKNAAGRTEIRLMTVTHGQHVWPGRRRNGIGNTRDISATDEVLRFFAEHP
jgi:polyhydroxybutyrate depolymerase